MKKTSKDGPRNFFPMPGNARPAQTKGKYVPHAFVLEAISTLSPWTRPMFGCLAVYVENRIVLVLRDKPDNLPDNGVWLATTQEHHGSLRRDFPSMRSIQVLGGGVTGWQVLPQLHENFEEEALRACEFILAGDPRIGKIPGAKRRKPKPRRKNEKPTKKVSTPTAKTKSRRGRKK